MISAAEVNLLMTKVIWHVTMSLDGFIAGPGGAMGWAFNYPGHNTDAEEIIATTGAVLGGRRGYEIGRKQRQRYRAQDGFSNSNGWHGPVFVLTHQPPSTETDPAVTFLSAHISEAVMQAQEAAAGKNVLVLGSDVARQCIGEGLIDEILIHVAPVLLGDGIRLFAHSGAFIKLQLISSSQSGQLVNLRYRIQP